MNIEIITLLVAVVNFLLGLFVYFKKKDSLSNRSFTLFSTVLSLWALSLYFYSQPILIPAEIWIKVVYFVGVFPMGLSLLYFSYIFPSDFKKFPIGGLLIWTIFSIPFLYLLFFTDLWVKEIIPTSWGHETILGSGYIYVAMYSVFIIAWVVFNFIKKYLSTTDKILKDQVKYVLLGIFSFMTIVSFIDLGIPLVFKTSRFFGLSPVSSLFIVGFTVFAITKYHLFEIKIILTEMLVVIMGLVLLVIPSLMPTIFLRILTVLIFLLFCFFSYFLIRLTLREIKRRQQMYKMAKQLEEAKIRSEALLVSISEGVFAVDREENIIHFNRAAEELSGYKASEVLGKPHYGFLQFVREPERPKIIEFIPRGLKGKTLEVNSGKVILIRKNRSELPVEATVAPIRTREGKIIGAIVVFRDVSKERKIQQMRREFSALVSHEVREPVTIIKGYLEMLIEEIKGKLTKEERKLITEANNAAGRLSDLVKEILDISRIEAERKEAKPITIDPVELAEKAVTKDIMQLFKHKKQKFIFTRPDSLPKVKVDPEFITLALKNILSNASKYTPEKGKVELKVYQSIYGIIFKVIDTGVGIPKKEQHKVFQKFFRASNTTQLERGTGLGLYISKLLIELSGGRVWFRSEEKKGTTFYLQLPVFKQ